MSDEKVTFQMIEHFVVLAKTEKGWTKEFNLVSWGGRNPVYDIRNWSPDHTKMGKGITLTRDELMQVVEKAKEL